MDPLVHLSSRCESKDVASSGMACSHWAPPGRCVRYMQRLEGFHDRLFVRVDVSGGHRNVGVTRLELVSRLRILTLRALTKGRPR